MRVRATLLVLTVSVLALGGCTTSADEAPAPSASATPTPSPTPEPSPTPTDGIQVHSNPETGIVFEDVPDLTGEEAEVYNWIAIHQNAFWETLRTNTVSPTYAQIASAEVQENAARIATNNSNNGVRIGGEFRTSISDVVVSGDTATGRVCDDFRQATFTTDAGEFSAADVEQDIPQRGLVELLRIEDDKWFVNSIAEDGTC